MSKRSRSQLWALAALLLLLGVLGHLLRDCAGIFGWRTVLAGAFVFMPAAALGLVSVAKFGRLSVPRRSLGSFPGHTPRTLLPLRAPASAGSGKPTTESQGGGHGNKGASALSDASTSPVVATAASAPASAWAASRPASGEGQLRASGSPNGARLARQESQSDVEMGLPPRGARSCPFPKASGRRVRFQTRVNALVLKDIRDFPGKSELWWQQADFDKFLQDRVEIARAYRVAAKEKGLDVSQVSCAGGSQALEGYKAMLEVNPGLKDESRRGLGLGRKRARAKNRDAYIAAVINEQARQRAAAGPLFVLDTEALAAAAQRVSAADLIYAQEQAAMYYQQDRALESQEPTQPSEKATLPEVPPCRNLSMETPAKGLPTSASVASTTSVTSTTSSSSECSSAPSWGSSEDSWCSGGSTTQPPTDDELADIVMREDSFVLNDEASPKPAQTPTQRFLELGCELIDDVHKHDGGFNLGRASKGFGLSRDKLQKVGLSVTGQSISKYQRLRQLKPIDRDEPSDCGESENTGGETDEDGLIVSTDSLHFIKEYRQWRLGATVRAGLPGYTTDAKTYGTRNEYRVWRAWQNQLKNQHRTRCYVI